MTSTCTSHKTGASVTRTWLRDPKRGAGARTWNLIKERLKTLLDGLEWLAGWLAPLALGLLLAREFWDTGMAKQQGDNLSTERRLWS